MKTVKEQMRELVDRLNYLTKKYDEGHPEVSDGEWDDLYFQLLDLEAKNQIFYVDSPTRTINYQVINELNKVEHNHKMLSLDKTKNLEDITKFANGKAMLVMSKCDGLTCSLRYVDGYLVSAETRGDGFIGEDVLHNALTCPSIPKRINYNDELIIDGEIICLNEHFEKYFKDEYANSRNFAAGSIRLLDASECAKRMLTFVAWDVIKGFNDEDLLSTRLVKLKQLGFTIVPFMLTSIFTDDLVDVMVDLSNKASIPIDGLVFKFDSKSYGDNLGETSHHFKNAIALKFTDEVYLTTLQDIIWTMGRTGVLTPVALFDTVDMDGSKVNRASLHNLTVMKETLNKPWKGQSIGVYKANMIIPQINFADVETVPEDTSKYIVFPTHCPICGEPLQEAGDNDSKFLECSNKNCEGKLINKLDHFCGKKGLDIKGLSKATLDKLISWGWVNCAVDIFNLEEHKDEWVEKPGFGIASVNKILDAIENSRDCSFNAFIAALGIPLIGSTVAKDLAKHFESYEELREAIDNKYDFSQLEGFAESKTEALLNFDFTEADQLYGLLDVRMSEIQVIDEQPLKDKKFVITGSLKEFKNRNALQTFIEEKGGKVVGTVSKNVDYLINNDTNSTTSKNITAKKLGIPILSETEFLNLTK